ncbi:hypothetical protein G647_07855 [Cladophialophora carrionii CBS 160.54]|uniref:Uncharacterized protein n=1 Tax=Cladophialophora carrionii CBS 160.54 TaxID=1279043 RepID=V9D5E1_9EURO|nr:uncharacterized protein G647_07855 [Cladophialophora carrionii CBS 160.54]ETI21508.1 hypothetical protein G647_07855 [Cladophialophora carrionii CBS 160.54]
MSSTIARTTTTSTTTLPTARDTRIHSSNAITTSSSSPSPSPSLSISTAATATATATQPRRTGNGNGNDNPASSEPSSCRPSLPRRSSSLHKLLITKLRPLPFQYLWWVWHSKSAGPVASTTQQPQPQPPRPFFCPQPVLDAYQLNLLVENVADIGAFYRIFNNLPWTSIRRGDSIHIFRAGVRPLWEDEENKRGGRWLIRVRPGTGAPADGEADARSNAHADARVRSEHSKGQDGRRKDVRTWEEVCLLCLGGELQSVIAQERDHILGLSFSPRANFTHISIWTKQGDNPRSILLLERAILSGLSSDLRPKPSADFNYRRHADKIGLGSGVGMQTMQSRQQSQVQVQMTGSFQSSLPTTSSAAMGRPGPIRALTVG